MTTTEQEIEELKVKIKEVEDKIKEVEQYLAEAKKDGNEQIILMYGNNILELRKTYNYLLGLINTARNTTGK